MKLEKKLNGFIIFNNLNKFYLTNKNIIFININYIYKYTK